MDGNVTEPVNPDCATVGYIARKSYTDIHAPLEDKGYQLS